jgi:hypothetical protein
MWARLCGRRMRALAGRGVMHEEGRGTERGARRVRWSERALCLFVLRVVR